MKKIRYIPYGYTMRNGRTVIAQDEAAVIREIFSAYINGASLQSIAELLTERKIPYSERTDVWDKARIARIIGNAKYIGDGESVSRFARNTVDCLDHVRMLRARGIGIYFEEQNIDTLQIDSELYLVIYAGFAQSESESISKNVTWTFRKRFQEGKPIFNYKCLLGYRKGAVGEPEIVPEEASIVERIFNMYLSGETINRISTKLREENLQIPGKRFSFSASMIKGILRNERYCGDSILQKTVTIDCSSLEGALTTPERSPYWAQCCPRPHRNRQTSSLGREPVYQEIAFYELRDSPHSGSG